MVYCILYFTIHFSIYEFLLISVILSLSCYNGRLLFCLLAYDLAMFMNVNALLHLVLSCLLFLFSDVVYYPTSRYIN